MIASMNISVRKKKDVAIAVDDFDVEQCGSIQCDGERHRCAAARIERSAAHRDVRDLKRRRARRNVAGRNDRTNDGERQS